MNAAGANIMRKNFAQLIGCHLPDKSRLVPKSRQPCQGVRRRTAANFTGRSHMPIKRLCALLVDKLHAALCEAFARNKRIICIGDDIHNGIANSKNVEAGISHKVSYLSTAPKGKAT